MAEVKVTYETLFDLLRRERSRNEIQQLDGTFYSDAVSYLKEKELGLTAGSALSSRAEQEKIKIQIKNVRKILRELYELREKKILNIALNKARTDSDLIDTASLTPEERVLFDRACSLLSEFKHEIIDRVIEAELPSVAVAPKPVVKETAAREDDGQRKFADQEALPVQKIRMTSDLPKFMWLDKNSYGPFASGDVAELPQKIAELLLRKGKAEVT